jgi:hypothetical protein
MFWPKDQKQHRSEKLNTLNLFPEFPLIMGGRKKTLGGRSHSTPGPAPWISERLDKNTWENETASIFLLTWTPKWVEEMLRMWEVLLLLRICTLCLPDSSDVQAILSCFTCVVTCSCWPKSPRLESQCITWRSRCSCHRLTCIWLDVSLCTCEQAEQQRWLLFFPSPLARLHFITRGFCTKPGQDSFFFQAKTLEEN